MNNYESRDSILLANGYASYQHYLASELWKLKRDIVLELSGWKCFACGSDATQVHHSKYTPQNLLGKPSKIDGLWAVCRECHERAEIRPDGSKTSLTEANVLLGRIRDARLAAEPEPPKAKWVSREKFDRNTPANNRRSMQIQRSRAAHKKSKSWMEQKENAEEFGPKRKVKKKPKVKAPPVERELGGLRASLTLSRMKRRVEV